MSSDSAAIHNDYENTKNPRLEALMAKFDPELLKSGGEFARQEDESDRNYMRRLYRAYARGHNKPRVEDHTSPAVKTFNALEQASKYGQHPADHIREDTAKSWAAGEHKTFDQRNRMMGKGGGVQDTFGALWATLESAKQLDSQLSAAPADADAAGQIWDAYDKATDELWSLLRTVRGKLEDSRIRQYIGTSSKTLFAEQVKVWEVLGPKIVSVVGPKLDRADPKRTTAKLEEWGPKTLGYMKQCYEKASA